ncbi:MAG TPA: M56 family metallopeptidase [Bacteroidales bacterium]|nr:M56 family metallopeptidase [Bacteroidales bacterium]
MNNLLPYLLRVSIGIILFYICYILFFSRDTFYLRNRIFLVATLVLSVLMPLVKLDDSSAGIGGLGPSDVFNAIIISGNTIEKALTENSFDFNSLIGWIYFSISAVLLFKLSISVIRTLKIIRKGTIIKSGFPKVVLSGIDHPSFSFFPFVVVPVKTYESTDYLQILAHENAHIKQGHTFDLLLIELFIAFLWFNPFIWLIRRAIVLNHEYLADYISIKASHDIKEYQYKLLNLNKSLMHVPLAHNFSSLIKNRIVMINKKPTCNYAALKSILTLPVVALLFVMFSFKSESNRIQKGDQKSLFSKGSESEILKFLAMNTGYPQEARNSLDTATVFVVVRMQKGGIVKECKALTSKKSINVPFLQEIVIVGYKPSGKIIEQDNATGKDHPALKAECLRIADKIDEVKIPEWNERDIDFAIPMKFTLK